MSENSDLTTDITDSYIRSKYINNQPDIIYLTDDKAVHYLGSTKVEFLKDKPIFFSGIHDILHISNLQEASGYVEKHEIGGLIKLINELFLGEPEITVLGSKTMMVFDLQNDINFYLKINNSDQKVNYIIEDDIDELVERIPNNKNSIFIIAGAGGFSNSERHETIKEAVRKITKRIPNKYIFTTHDIDVFGGVLGGLVTSGYNQGFAAGRKAMSLLVGQEPNLSIQYAQNKYIFDRQALKKAKIKIPSHIEIQSKILNEDLTFIERYGQQVIFAIFVLLGIIIISSILFTISTIKQKREISDKSQKLKDANSRIQQYLNAVDASSLVYVANPAGKIKYINHKYISTIGCGIEELIGKPVSVLNHPDMDSQCETISKQVSSGEIWTGVLMNRTKSGEDIYLETSTIPIIGDNDKIEEYLSIRKDITQTVKQQQQIKKQYRDPLTGLPNRTRLREDIKKVEKPATAMVNIDGFSIINTYYGIEAGDQILKQFTKQVQKIIKPNMQLYRISGDEFAVLGKEIGDYNGFNAFISRMMEKLSEVPFIYNNNEIRLSMTSGTSDGQEGSITKAGMALKQARHQNKSLMTYSEAENYMQNVRDDVQYASVIRDAIAQDRIVPHFQPVVDTVTGEVVKYEALMRIKDEDGNYVPPGAFLELSKKLKLYRSLSTRMIEKTIEIVKDSENHRVCINFDKEDVLNNKLQEMFFSKIKEYNLQGRITIEITEAESVDNLPELGTFVTRARQEGCLIAIDDFGTGYSNFMYILNLQPDFLKIDGSITRQINDSKRAMLLSKTITEMCRNAGIKTVAEFVSDEKIHEQIKYIKADYCQGYLFGKPEPFFIT